MFSIKKLQEQKDSEEAVKKDEKEVNLKDLSALQSVACSVIKSSIADSNSIGNQVGAQG